MFGEERKWTKEQRAMMLDTLPVSAPKVLGDFPPGAFDTEEGTETIVKHWYTMVRALFESDKYLNQTGFVFVTRDQNNMPVHTVLHMEIKDEVNERSKDCLADGMKLIASMCAGVATIMVSEAWMCMAKPADMEAVMAYRKKHGSLRNHPDTRESVVMMVETSRGSRLHMAAIVRHPDGSRTLGEWQLHDGNVQEGRFAGLLRSEKEMADA